MTAALAETWTVAGGSRMHALTGGGGTAVRPPVVLVHGLGVSSRYWRPLASRLAVHYPVYAPDLPGHGPSSRPATALDVPGLCAALAAWLDAARLGPAVFVANSLGCQVVAELAVRQPERAHALVLCGPTVDPEARSSGGQILRVLLSAPAENPLLGGILLSDYLRMGPVRVGQELGHMLRHRIECLLPAVAIPVLVVRGRWDRVAPRRWAERVAATLPQGSIVEIPAAGHAAHFTRTRAVMRRLLPFLERHVGERHVGPR
jgi:2-hydroxy-6-oxonona-2,4-dienedioate hydrolase